MKSQRTKGRRGEQEIVKFWRDIFPNARRHLEFQIQEADKGIDVTLNEKYVVQSKIGSCVPSTIYKFLNQMKVEERQMGFVQCKRDGKQWLVIIDAEKFKKIIK